MKNFFKNKRSKLKLFPFIFNSISGEPFRCEIYDINGEEKKIEFFFLKQSEYNSYFLDMKQYVVWSIVDDLYRVLVDESYYSKFEILYQKEINIIYMNFLQKLLYKRYKIIRKNFLYYFLSIFFSLFLIYFFYFKEISFLKEYQYLIFFIIFILNFVFLFFYTKVKQRDFFQNYKTKLLKETMKNIKSFLGVEVFENISKQQRMFSSEFFDEKEK
ncbi:hypothetical protein CWO85_01325 [Candidatus Phytoplasma ziziphi]|uniref:Uncharacterized protein n=2 Tax=Ziziphus jujuba witches'-broom phytoplasma TaxID=135727 RepID=A0A660HMG3_ZIZJU|nr:hypothetical protein [Candidatus Phytoplasma ziziphi]AYJ01172.1 hypothetical protein CWO85_01325 [Candidatus Phytoplasma ziziphi]